VVGPVAGGQVDADQGAQAEAGTGRRLGVACSFTVALAPGASRVPARTRSVVAGPRVTTRAITMAAAASNAT
jgi:hypothetical protein